MTTQIQLDSYDAEQSERAAQLWDSMRAVLSVDQALREINERQSTRSISAVDAMREWLVDWYEHSPEMGR